MYQISITKLDQFSIEKKIASALETANGAVYTGICIDVPCSIGICAEQAAIADMLKHGETQIKKL